MNNNKIIYLEASLPFPPTNNHLYGQCGYRRFLTAAARKWKEEALLSLAGKFNGPAEKPDKVIVEFWYYPADRRKRDTHNLPKMICDVLKVVTGWDDDCYLCREMDRERGKEKENTVVVRMRGF